MCACEFEAHFDKDVSVLYRNIKKLEEAGLVSTSKNGRELHAEVRDEEVVESLIRAAETLESDLPELIGEDIKEA